MAYNIFYPAIHLQVSRGLAMKKAKHFHNPEGSVEKTADSSPSGIIFDIKRFAIHDGPGIRTTVFFKGCPLCCWWCHNPEGIKPGIEEIRGRGKNGKILEIIGEEKTDVKVMEEIDKEVLFFDQSEGGVTFSGGEPLMQPDFLLALLRRCREKGIHTALDTSGYTPDGTIFDRIIPWVNLFLFDLKFMDNSLHRKFIGKDNRLIIENLKKLNTRRKEVIIRFPIIPTITDSEENIRQIARFLLTLPAIRNISLLAYHGLAGKKYQKLKIQNRIDGLLEKAAADRGISRETMINQSSLKVRAIFESHGFHVCGGG